MEELRSQINGAIDKLRQERDELRVKVSLAKMEASDEWRDLEKNLERLEAKAKELKGATAESAGDIGAAARLLVEELRNGFKNIARHV